MSADVDTPIQLEVPGTVAEVHTQRHRLAPFFGALATLASFLPSVPYNASGKRNRIQIRVVLVILGLLFVLASDRNIALIVLGFVLMASASTLPLSELQKRDLLRKLKSMKTTQKITQHPVHLKHDGRRLELWQDGTMIRRVLTNRAFVLQEKRLGEQLWVGVLPKDSKKKRDALWFSMPADGVRIAELDEFNSNRADHPIDVSGEKAQQLRQRLHTLHKRPHTLSA